MDPGDELRSRWESIIADADIREVPIDFLKTISVVMLDGTTHDFDVIELLALGLTVLEIEDRVQEFLEINDDIIDTIDFHINVNALATEVDQKTRGLLG